MLKNVILDNLHALKTNISAVLKTSGSMLVACIMIFIFAFDKEDIRAYRIIFYFFIILGLLIAATFPMNIPLAMRLTPVTRDEMRKYIKIGMRLNVFVPFVMFVLAAGITGFAGKMIVAEFVAYSVYYIAQLAAMTVICGFSSNVIGRTGVKWPASMIVYLICFFISVALTAYSSANIDSIVAGSVLHRVIAAIAFFGSVVPALYVFITKRKRVIEMTIDGELKNPILMQTE